jgi:transcriptional regulator with XRE-family HTH domain
VRPRDILAENIRLLMTRNSALNTIRKLSEQSGVPNGTVGRVCKGEVNLGVDYLEPLADAFGVEPWQLLRPNPPVQQGTDGQGIGTSPV